MRPSTHFLGIGSLFFFYILALCWKPIWFCWISWYCRVLLINLVINFPWSCSIMKVCIICYIPAQILYLEKIWFLIYGLKCLGQSDDRIFESTISLKQNDEIGWFFACRYKFMKVKKFIEKFWVWPILSWTSKIGCISVINWCSELIWIFACWHKFKKAKSWSNHVCVGVVKNGRDL